MAMQLRPDHTFEFVELEDKISGVRPEFYIIEDFHEMTDQTPEMSVMPKTASLKPSRNYLGGRSHPTSPKHRGGR